MILQRARTRRQTTFRPVLIGESGLDATTPDNPTLITTAAHADVGLRHAVWAGIVSGACNARALYWEDGYAVFFPSVGMSLVKKYASVESTVGAFLGDTDFTGLESAGVIHPTTVFGAALARSDLVIGWFRDATCVAPHWVCDTTVVDVSLAVELPPSASSGTWAVTVYDPQTGNTSKMQATATNSVLDIALPPFKDATAFRAQR